MSTPVAESSGAKSVESTPGKPRGNPQRGQKRKRCRAFGGGHVRANGNYQHYYRRRLGSEDAASDSRLALLQKKWVQGGAILDIGCNDGALTIEVARMFSQSKVVGIDIDKALVQKARDKVRLLGAVKKAEIRNEHEKKEKDFVPLSCLVVQGHRNSHSESQLERPTKFQKATDSQKSVQKAASSAPASNAVGASSSSAPQAMSIPDFPFNVQFRNEDISSKAETKTTAEHGKYDLILCLSVTKWIHLHGGDDAIKLLFSRVLNCLTPGGVFVLEPQLKRSYKNARKKGAVSNDLTMDKFNLRPEMFSQYLLSPGCGFESMEMLREAPKNKTPFGTRPVMAFFKKKSACSSPLTPDAIS